MNNYYAKDFIETPQGLRFAVVSHGTENGKVLCFLRYVFENGQWHKVNTTQANELLTHRFPQYVHYSSMLDAHCHAVSIGDISLHYQPRERLQHLLQRQPVDLVEQDLQRLCHLFQQKGVNLSDWGITGSLLIGVQNVHSDIDLLCYDLKAFHQGRKAVVELLNEHALQELALTDWQETFKRRDCALSFNDYVWHEQRKFNKALINRRKFDMTCCDINQPISINHYQKGEFITLQAVIIDDSKAFDYPAEWVIDNDEINTVVSFTATYIGQAVKGERIEIAGFIETAHNIKRIVIGTDREAHGQYIKVV